LSIELRTPQEHDVSALVRLQVRAVMLFVRCSDVYEKAL
jgi:hypothetical protein